MRYLTDSHTMKAVDNCSIHEFGIPSVVLMERAALGVSAFLRKHAEHNNKKTGIKVVYAEAGIMVQMVLQQQDSLMKMELMYMLCLLVHRRELMNTGFRNQLSVILELTVLNMMAILIFLNMIIL